jgi:hypothetical protein
MSSDVVVIRSPGSGDASLTGSLTSDAMLAPDLL